ncbi:uncharacterized protein LOC114645041 [Erpetoichthys calabaricus]|uniref:uncharacterized protein LOC114645041 n=1 Tax=Erpetoichthys calabaricus TaxID=27687 RepID=UPI002234A120|nr:uncharacterized protein LOC114645041 [Erpetoichthys calabaricus]
MGMILPHDSLSGLPEFIAITHMIVHKDKLLFVVRKLCSWHQEHYRAYELKVCPTKAIDGLVDYRVIMAVKTVRLLVILKEDSSIRMDLENGIPDNVEQLIEEVKNSCGLEENLRLQYKDMDFEILRTQQWPREFPIPVFSNNTECQLEKGNAEYSKSQTRLNPSPKVLSDILDKVAEEIYKYKAYPTDADFSDVAKALTQKHPCLREPGSFNENYGWKQRFKYKMGNNRTLLRSNCSSPELIMNSLKHISHDDSLPTMNIKRAKRADANHYPSLPTGKTPDSLEEQRISLLNEVKKKKNGNTIKMMMAKTFRYRRQEIVGKLPRTENVVERWPTLFQVDEINAEFIRITTVPLQVRFISQSDTYSSQLLEMMRSKAGSIGERTTTILRVLKQDVDINIKRDCILKSLIVYMEEKAENLIREFLVSQEMEASGDLQLAAMAITVFREDEDLSYLPKDIGVIIEGVMVLSGLPTVTMVFIMLLGLIYVLNLQCPKEFKFTFEVAQKILMGLDTKQMTARVKKLHSALQSAS